MSSKGDTFYKCDTCRRQWATPEEADWCEEMHRLLVVVAEAQEAALTHAREREEYHGGMVATSNVNNRIGVNYMEGKYQDRQKVAEFYPESSWVKVPRNTPSPVYTSAPKEAE